MKIIFMGTPAFAVPSIDILLQNNYNISALVTVPDKRKGRGLKIQYSEVKKFALANNLNVIQPDNLKDELFISEIKRLNPDLIIVVAFKILPESVFTIPKSGTFNLHASLLPKYRGAAPINRAIMNGEKKTGVTTFFLEKSVDTGNIILQKEIEIDNSDNAGTLHGKLSLLGAETVLETVKIIESGNVITVTQDESLATGAPKIFKEDCRINWHRHPEIIRNLIRGLSPYPAAFTFLENNILKIFSSELTNYPSDSEPGMLSVRDKKLFVNTSGNLLELTEVQPEGKRRMTSHEFINGLDKNKVYKLG
ncbi:MAG: methionyl-tRNA formyltransferase [Ignavibacteria bacterium]|nr:methionyl-tRNA formyltransferase [Ignavibacteria bacterium]